MGPIGIRAFRPRPSFCTPPSTFENPRFDLSGAFSCLETPAAMREVSPYDFGIDSCSKGDGPVPHPRLIGDVNILRRNLVLMYVLDHFFLKFGRLVLESASDLAGRPCLDLAKRPF